MTLFSNSIPYATLFAKGFLLPLVLDAPPHGNIRWALQSLQA